MRRDVRRPASSPSKAEGERLSAGQSPPKSCVDVKSERTQDSPEQHSADVKPVLLGTLPTSEPVSLRRPLFDVASVWP